MTHIDVDPTLFVQNWTTLPNMCLYHLVPSLRYELRLQVYQGWLTSFGGSWAIGCG